MFTAHHLFSLDVKESCSKFLVFSAIVMFISERYLKISLKRYASDVEAVRNTICYR